jgi:hypothetical protein
MNGVWLKEGSCYGSMADGGNVWDLVIEVGSNI